MASGALLTQFNPGDLYRETSLGYDIVKSTGVYATSNGACRALSLQKLIQAQLKEYYNGMWIVPSTVGLATGLTHKFIITDDGTSAADLGLVVRIGVTPFNLSTALTCVDWSLAASMGTETFVNVTLGATTGIPVIATVAIVVANLASLATGSIYGMRVRRVGDNTADTCPGRVLILGGHVYDT